MSIKLMTAVWDRTDLASTQKLVLLALADWANDEGLCWPSIDRVSIKSSLKRRAVQMAIRSLEDSGFLRREEVVGKGNRYWITIPVQNMHPCTKDAPPVQEMHPTRASDAPNTSITHQDTPKDIKLALPDWIPVDAWNGWLEMRRIKKKPLTARSWNRAVARLEDMMICGQDITEVLDRSTMNGWTDLYEIRGGNNGKNNRTGGTDRRSSLARAIDEGLDYLS